MIDTSSKIEEGNPIRGYLKQTIYWAGGLTGFLGLKNGGRNYGPIFGAKGALSMEILQNFESYGWQTSYT